MLTLLQNIECFTPETAGRQDILVAADKIAAVSPPRELPVNAAFEVIDCTGLSAYPGFVDQHVHITGGGGEAGFASRVGELDAQALLSAGITTVVGLLGADGTARHMETLYAKAKALEAEGLTTYIYAGSYGLPPVTLTGSLQRDIVFVDKVIGAGEIAVSDHRSSNPDSRALIGIASEVHLGGLLTGKAGVVHLHLGDGKAGLGPLVEALELSDLPPEMFVPTHTNRNPALFRQAIEYCRATPGGCIDLTAGEKAGLAVPAAVAALKEQLPELSCVTVSSDAGGSAPSGSNASGGGAASPASLYTDFLEIIKQSILPPGEAAALFTANAAKRLKLYPQKGTLLKGSDADLLILDRDYQIRMIFARGRLLVDRRG